MRTAPKSFLAALARSRSAGPAPAPKKRAPRISAAHASAAIDLIAREGAGAAPETMVPLSFVRQLNPALADALEAEIANARRAPVVVSFLIPIQPVNPLNKREHRMARARRVKAERATTASMLLVHRDQIPRVAETPGLEVHLTRIGPRLLDSDAVGGSLKGVRDEIAKFLGVDDGPKSPVRWEYAQERGAYGVRVEFRAPRREE